ncbi:MAG: hypothetical protein WA771_15305 [Chthoniobacterales bacterium]
MSRSLNLHEMLAHAASILHLPYIPGLFGGGAKVLVGMWLLLSRRQPDFAKTVSAWLVANPPSADTKAPALVLDPLGALFGSRPLQDWDKWRRSPVPLREEIYSPFFSRLIEAHLKIVIETCVANDVEAALPLKDPTLVHRLWQQGVHLTAISTCPIGSDIDSEKVRALAVVSLKGPQPSLPKQINGNWASSTIHRRQGGPLVLRRRYELLGIDDPCEVSAAAYRWLEGLSKGGGETSDLVQRPKGYGNEDIRLVLNEGGIGAGHFVDLARSAINQVTALGSVPPIGASAAALMICAFVLPENIRDVECSVAGDCIIVKSPLVASAEYREWDPTLLLPQAAPFLRAVPAGIGHCLTRLQSLPPELIRQELTLFLRTIDPAMSIEMVLRFLNSQASLCFSLPRTFSAFGFAPDGKPLAFGGWLAYARHDPESATRMATPYYEAIGLDPVQLTEASRGLTTCGSGAVMTTEVSSFLFSTLTDRLACANRVESGDCRLRSLARWNGTVALYALALQALCFRRPYPFELPEVTGVSPTISLTHAEPEYEKIGPRRISVSPIASDLSRLMYRRWSEVYEHFSPEPSARWPRFACGAFLSLPNENILPRASTYASALEITRALAHDAELCGYKRLFPGCARHTADFALRMAGFTESQIDLLSDHSAERSRARLGGNSLEGPPSRELHARGELAVARHLGIR